MPFDQVKEFRSVKIGIILILLGFLFGLGLGIVFGVFEDNLKDNLKKDAGIVLQQIYQGDQAKADKIVSKSWVYIKRAHFHATGMATIALLLTIIMCRIPVAESLKKLIAIFFGIGSIGYPLSWLLAGLNAPALGSTGVAKSQLVFLAAPSIGFYSFGFLVFFALILKILFLHKVDSNEESNQSLI
ncbi:MAG: hypothetical protein OEY59_02040 [Deltaproteobacteria bacterium]|nr:hypothetical protein [Deltaproteobacteria bacterium]